jgi:hypothetical protein
VGSVLSTTADGSALRPLPKEILMLVMSCKGTASGDSKHNVMICFTMNTNYTGKKTLKKVTENIIMHILITLRCVIIFVRLS